MTDETLAQVLDRIAQAQPRAIGLDIFRDIPVPPGGEELAKVLQHNPNIIAIMKFGNGRDGTVPPPPVLENTEQIGANDIIVDPDSVVRRGLLFLDDGKTTAYAFALRLALLYLQAEGIVPQPDPLNPQYLRLGPNTIRPFAAYDGAYIGADARGYQFLLDFKGAQWPFQSFSLTALLSGAVSPEVLKDKIVLLGVTAESVKDFFSTPYNHGFLTKQQTSGIATQAHIVSQLLRLGLGNAAPLRTATEWQEWAWVLLWSILGSLIGLRVRSPWRFALGMTGVVLFLILLGAYVLWRGWWIPLVPPILATSVAAAIVTAYMSQKEKAQRVLLMQLFSRHVSPEIAETLWQRRAELFDEGRLRPQRAVVTVLFTDLRGFTTVSEKLDEETLMGWLNTYLEAVVQVVINHGGVIDDYAGDGIKADFGVPLPRTTEAEIAQDAVNAVLCALAIEETVQRLNTLWQERALPAVGMRLGIFTGPVVAGSLGSVQRLKYTTLGDTVNTASRLESLAQDGDGLDVAPGQCRILIGEATLHYLGQQFVTQRVGEVSLKGKEQKVIVHRVLGRTQQPQPTAPAPATPRAASAVLNPGVRLR